MIFPKKKHIKVSG